MVEECSFEGVEVLGEDLVELGAGEDTGVEVALTHDGEVLRASAVLGRCDQFEVTCAPVKDVAIDVINLQALCAGPNPGLIDEMMTTWDTDKILHPRVVGMDVGLMLEVLRPGWFDFIDRPP